MEKPTQILIIEDNGDDEILLFRQLTQAGLAKHLKVVRDGESALVFLADKRSCAERLAAIFLDLNLPKVPGIKILEAIRSDQRLASIPVIIMTSVWEHGISDECSALGIDGFVAKPLTFFSFAKAFADTFHRPLVKTRGFSALVE